MNTGTSKKAFREAQSYIPGGVDSPVRAFKNIGRTPLFIDRAKGPFLYDVDGNRYSDHCLSWGVHILGHNHPAVMAAVLAAAAKGTSFGAPSVLETELARRLIRCMPSIHKVRFVSSGTEAVMSAIRLARAFTKRDLVIKFDGCYHGHADHLLVCAGSGVSALNKSSSAGVPAAFAGKTISVPFNDIPAVRQAFNAHKGQIAAVIVEPVPANMGVILPRDGFLEQLRRITRRNGALLIFDEVITGFRWHIGGAQGYFDIKPDLTTLGKIIGGGFPVGAFGGRTEIMDLLAPGGPVYQAGTLSGNPVAMAAGIAVLDQIAEKSFYKKLNAVSAGFITELSGIAQRRSLAFNAIGTMFSIFFTPTRVKNYTGLQACDTKAFARAYRRLLENNIYLSPAQGETNFISSSHSHALMQHTLSCISQSISTT